jgi:hypothetical protein
MAPFGYPKHKQKKLEFTQHFGTQSSLWVKINLDSMFNEEDWIKSTYIKYITYSFSTAIGLHVCDSWNITKQFFFEKIIQCSFIKSLPLWYGSGFSLKIYILLCIHCWTNARKHIFQMEFHPKTLNF